MLVFAILGFLPIPVSASDRHDHAALEPSITRELETQGLQGSVWSLVSPDGVSTGAAGVRDARSGSPMHATDKVQVGSIAKTVLAVGVLRLVTEGRLALDAPVASMLPELAFDNAWQATDPVRVRHLLDHTAGLDDARLSQVFSRQVDAGTPLRETLADVLPLVARHRPGTRASYSNTSYVVLGMLIERVTGTRYEAWLDDNVLAPIGMHDSTFAFAKQEGERADARLAMGHFEKGVAQAAVPTRLRPAAQFTTTAADMARFARFLLEGRAPGGETLVDAALLRMMGKPSTTDAAVAGLRVGYGLGLATRDRHGVIGLCHGGNTVGYRAMLCVLPGQDRAFFIAHNADVEDADYGRFDAMLIEALGVESTTTSTPALRGTGAASWDGFYEPSPNRFASLAWIDAVFGIVRVRGEGEGLRVGPIMTDGAHLFPAGGSLWRAQGRAIASHALFFDPDGTRTLSTGMQTFAQVTWPTVAARWLSAAAGILGLAWLLLGGLLPWRGAVARPGFVPFLGIVALALPLPLFLAQPFVAIGDMTIASVLLAVVTASLPVTMLAGLACVRGTAFDSPRRCIDTLAMLAVLQLSIALACRGLLPLRSWA
ncbi:serine hydrolase domain-containing protein [Dokdonella sp. MW10]|uniref:serine hydrolase domain-containing protein n=1 Tax=Dokdonella sp. MW10 TaxID=2992926 RepID=UPI003F7EFB7A